MRYGSVAAMVAWLDREEIAEATGSDMVTTVNYHSSGSL